MVRTGKTDHVRKVTCGAGTMMVRLPRVHDQGADEHGKPQRFTGRLWPPYLRRSLQVSERAARHMAGSPAHGEPTELP